MASSATKHFIRQRVTAMMLFVLSIWLVISVLMLIGSDREGILTWASQWWNTALLASWFVCVPLHMSIGIGDIIDDYIHKKGTRSALSLLNSLYAFAIGIGGVVAVLAIAFIA